jgi:IclR family pca regulon transcriptional regulator
MLERMKAHGAAETGKDRDFVASLARGLSVIRVFDKGAPEMTLSQVAARAGLTRSTARRFLLTLSELGYVRMDGKLFRLTPRVLDLGFAFLASNRLPELVQPYLERISAEVHESCSLCVLEGRDVVYLASVPAKRILSAGQSVGTRRPAYVTSMGRVLLAGLTDSELSEYLVAARFERLTGSTVTDPAALREIVASVRAQGYALVDQELEEGLRSIAVPILGRGQQTLAAITVCGHANRVGNEEMVQRILPILRRAVVDIHQSMPR